MVPDSVLELTLQLVVVADSIDVLDILLEILARLTHFRESVTDLTDYVAHSHDT